MQTRALACPARRARLSLAGVLTRLDCTQSKHIVVMWYSIIMHLRRQPVLPKHSRITLYLYPDEQDAWEAADVRPLYNLMQIGHHIARLRDKGILSDGESVMMAQEVKILTQIFGTMEAVRDTPTLPFVYFQFCNWMALAYCLTVPAAIATHDTYYTSCSLFSFFAALTFLGINQMGNLLQEPFGLGPNDMPMERWGQVLEHELYQLFPWFRFRFEGFPLFVDDLEILPPDDPRAKPKKDVVDVEIKSNWVPARNKIKAAMRLGNPRFRKFREAKMLRESMVKDFMQHRRKQEQNDMASLIAALAKAGIGGAGATMGKKTAKGGAGKTEDAQGAAADAGADSSDLPKELTVGRGRKARAPAELAPKSSLVKQATILQKRFPESETLQRLMQQMVNPRVPDADKNALLALMNAEADALAAELGVDIK